MASAAPAKVVPLTCHGHSRPVTHLSFSSMSDSDEYYLISGCKDNHPMLREGMTGDWIGTFIGHKGAVWQSRLSETASHAVTGSADFTAKIWDPHSGECLHTLQHNHIVRAVSFVPGPTPQLVATGGFEKKLRIFDLYSSASGSTGSSATNGTANGGGTTSYEVGAGVHEGNIKSIVWGPDRHIVVSAAEDKIVRWWDLRESQKPISTFNLDGPLGTCELNQISINGAPQKAVLSVAGGKTAYFFSGNTPGELLSQHKTNHEIASVAINYEEKKFVTGGSGDTWVRVYDSDDGKEISLYKGHHGPVWSTNFSPDGKLCATGSEDGTIKLWKFTTNAYGLWK